MWIDGLFVSFFYSFIQLLRFDVIMLLLFNIVYWNYLSKFFLLSRCLLHKVETLHSSSNLFQLNIEFSYYIFSNLSCIRIQWNLMFVKDFYTIIPSTNSLEVILIILCCAERWNGNEKTKINEIKVSNGISR